MNSRRTVVLIVALVIGLVAAVSLFSYVQGIEDRAYDNAERVKVFKVGQDVPKGTPGETAISEEFVVSSEIPREFRPATALTDINAIRGKVAVLDLSANQVVVDGMFVDPRVAQITFSERIPPGQVAISVSISGEKAVANLLVPGDRVNILVTDPTNGQTRYLFQNVNILAIGSSAAPEPGETGELAAGAGLLTFAVPPFAAEQIAFVGGGGMYLTLVPPDNQPVPVPGVDANNLFSGGLTPYPEEG